MTTNARHDAGQEELARLERALRALFLDEEPRFVEGIPRRAQEVYRRLVRSSLMTTTLNGFPIARRLVGEEKATALVAKFLERAPPTTRLLRDVPMQFATWLIDEAARGAIETPHPAFAECVHWEAVEIDVLHAPRRDATSSVAAMPTRASTVVLDPSTRLVAYRFDVHKMTSRSGFPAAPRRAPAILLAWRDGERFVFRELSPKIAALVAKLGEGLTLASAMAALVDEGQPPLDEGFVFATLVTLARRGALVGFATEPA